MRGELKDGWKDYLMTVDCDDVDNIDDDDDDDDVTTIIIIIIGGISNYLAYEESA